MSIVVHHHHDDLDDASSFQTNVVHTSTTRALAL
jgi:hypothetical protein